MKTKFYLAGNRFSSAPLNRKIMEFRSGTSDCVMTSKTSSIIAQLTASSLAPGL